VTTVARSASSSLTLLATVFVDLVDAELAAGRWQMLPDGELTPVDKPAGKVLQFPQSPAANAKLKEESHAEVQGSAAAS
jgi:hypothetical protein